MLVIYNVIHRQKAKLGYSLVIKTKRWTETKKLIRNLTYNKMITSAKGIKETNKYTNLAILVFE